MANVQLVMGYIIDAVEAGEEDISNGEIVAATGLSPDTVRPALVRGFARLKREAHAAGVTDKDFDFAKEDPDDEGEEDDNE